jgi:transposase
MPDWENARWKERGTRKTRRKGKSLLLVIAFAFADGDPKRCAIRRLDRVVGQLAKSL